MMHDPKKYEAVFGSGHAQTKTRVCRCELFENQIWMRRVIHTAATSTAVITGLVPVIHVFLAEFKRRRGWPGQKGVHARLRKRASRPSSTGYTMPGHDEP
jgi:hypothetical protein